MTRRRTTTARLAVAGVMALALTALTACGNATTSGPGTPPSGSTSRSPRESGAMAMVGLWTVEAATGRPAGERSVLRLAAGELSWWRGCGVLFGSWEAGAGMLLLDVGRSSVGSCSDAPEAGDASSRASTWLSRTARFERDGDGWRLLDAAGREQARLRPGAVLKPRADVDASLAAPPTLDAAARAELVEPAPLPAGVRAASRATAAGRWTLPEATSGTSERSTTGGKPPFLFVAPDGTWTGWDGCNGASGRWLVGDGGRLLTTSGSSTLIGCEGVDLPGLWTSAARIGFDGRLLVLVDPGGRELVRLTGPRVVPTMTHGPVQR